MDVLNVEFFLRFLGVDRGPKTGDVAEGAGSLGNGRSKGTLPVPLSATYIILWLLIININDKLYTSVIYQKQCPEMIIRNKHYILCQKSTSIQLITLDTRTKPLFPLIYNQYKDGWNKECARSEGLTNWSNLINCKRCKY